MSLYLDMAFQAAGRLFHGLAHKGLGGLRLMGGNVLGGPMPMYDRVMYRCMMRRGVFIGRVRRMPGGLGLPWQQLTSAGIIVATIDDYSAKLFVHVFFGLLAVITS